MNRRERILTAIDRKMAPDAVPVGFDISGDHLTNLCKYYGAKDLGSLYEACGIEAFSVWTWPAVIPDYVGPKREWVDGPHDTFSCWGKRGLEYHPLEDVKLKDYEWPTADHFDFSGVIPHLEDVRGRDMTTAVGHLGVGYQHHVEMRSHHRIFYDLYEDDWMEEYTSRVGDFFVAYFEELFRSADGLIDIVRADEDVGSQDSMLISPDMWRRWYKPVWGKCIDICKRNGSRVWLHSCGCCRDIVPDFIELGVDILNPIPPYVNGSDPSDMKATFGGQLSFDGGVDQINSLTLGTSEDVRQEVIQRLVGMSPGGGYIIGPSQVFNSDMSFENIIAFFETILDCRDKGIGCA